MNDFKSSPIQEKETKIFTRMRVSLFSKRNLLWLMFALVCMVIAIYIILILDGDLSRLYESQVLLQVKQSSPGKPRFILEVKKSQQEVPFQNFPLIFSKDWKTSVVSKYGFRLTDSQIDQEMEPTIGEDKKTDDPKLLNNIRKYFIDPPSPYIYKSSYPIYEHPAAIAVDNILQKKRKGFFVECGANDGERASNTIYLERKRDWKGLLIEMDPSFYLQILGKNRNSYSMNACISRHNYTSKMKFEEHYFGGGKLVSDDETGSLIRTSYCFPFYSIMLAMNITHIDYFSLDVEGAELDILKTIPYDKLDISVISAEWVHGKGGEKPYVEFMKSKGYKKHSTISKADPDFSIYHDDVMFVKESLL